MPATKLQKSSDFRGQSFFIGIDVHKSDGLADFPLMFRKGFPAPFPAGSAGNPT
jgi:hypothetical protein